MSNGACDHVNTGPYVRQERQGNVDVISLARPERHNALVPELIDGVRACLAHIATDTDVRAVVLRADGKNFSTGGDVAAFATHEGDALAAYARQIVGSLNEMILDLMRLDVPVVAAVRGAVTGGSLGFLLGSDTVLIAPDATIAPYYVDVGFSPDGGWTALLPQRIGRAEAASLQYANAALNARRAVECGLAFEVPDHDVDQAALELAERYAGKLPGSVRRTKRLLREDLNCVRERLDAELESFIDQIQSYEARSGMNEFLSRAPRS